MDKERINYLCNRYLQNVSTAAELQELEAMLADARVDDLVKDVLDDIYLNMPETFSGNDINAEAKERIFQYIIAQPQNRKPVNLLWRRISVAAAAAIIVTAGLFYVKQKQSNVQTVASHAIKNDILPGGNRATLTLANGQHISLTDAHNGALAKQTGVTITKAADGKLVYTLTHNGAHSATTEYNTIETPIGGLYQINLQDGTKVWLNSASSIKYPVSFANNERRVELTGEAYFEVAHRKNMPFRVVSNGQTVEVLGTHFNINSYADERELKTTLLEGSVKVSSQGASERLKPGQQSQLFKGRFTVEEVDVNEAVAWKNGYFNFKDDDIQTVMRQLARWYDVDVKYEGVIPQKEYSGQISMNLTANQILDILSFNKIHYRINGKTIVITP